MAMSKKDKQIKAEIRRYSEIYKDLTGEDAVFVEKLYNRAAFMSATLDELQERINEEGAVITTLNSRGVEQLVEHPAQKSYNAMIKNYTNVISALIKKLPDTVDDDALVEFMKK